MILTVGTMGGQKFLVRDWQGPIGEQKFLVRDWEGLIGKQQLLVRDWQGPKGRQNFLVRDSQGPIGRQKFLVYLTVRPRLMKLLQAWSYLPTFNSPVSFFLKPLLLYATTVFS